jgi:hypothetical protein
MKTAISENSDWRRVGKSKAKCIVVGANSGYGGTAAPSFAHSVKPLNTYPQAYDPRVDEHEYDEHEYYQGYDKAPGVETMAKAGTKTKKKKEAPASLGVPEVESITEIERDEEVKETETSTITSTQSSQGRYATIGRSGGNNRPKEETATRGRSTAKASEARRRGRDLHGGMELLSIDFLLDIVENIESTEEAEVSMRMLSLHELMRTSRISEVDSNVLRYYCMDEDSIYDGQIQLEAMKELAERTRQHTI